MPMLSETTGFTTQLGAIAFINTLPIYGPWQPQPNTQLVYAPPSALNTALLKGSLKISPVSSAFFLAHTAELVLLPGLSVSSYGSVSSVLVLSHVPMDQVTHMGVPDDSATSVALLKLFCLDKTGHIPEMTVYPADQMNTALKTYQALLVIGDRALTASVTPPTPCVFDLSDWWVARTGLPVVFAVWAANRHWYQQHSARAHQLIDTLCQSRNQFFDDALTQTLIIEKAVTQSGLPARVISRYFTQSLNYAWLADHEASLQRFADAIACGTMA